MDSGEHRSARKSFRLGKSRKSLALHSWVFRVSRWLGLWPFSGEGLFKRHLTFRAWLIILIAGGLFCWTRKKRLKLILDDGGLEITRFILGSLIESFMFLGCIGHILATHFMKDEFKIVISTLHSIKNFTLHTNIYFVGILIIQVVSGYLSIRVFKSISLMSLIGSLDLLLVGTLNYVIILLFYSTLKGIESLMKFEIARLKHAISLTRFVNISRACEITNKLYQRQMLLTLIQIFGYFITYGYHFWVGLIRKENGLPYSTFLALGLFIRFAILMMLASCCDDLHRKAEAFNTELFKVVLERRELCQNRKLRLYLTRKERIDFTACGFFSLGCPLVTSIIAAATTYLVILIQFSL